MINAENNRYWTKVDQIFQNLLLRHEINSIYPKQILIEFMDHDAIMFLKFMLAATHNGKETPVYFDNFIFISKLSEEKYIFTIGIKTNNLLYTNYTSNSEFRRALAFKDIVCTSSDSDQTVYISNINKIIPSVRKKVQVNFSEFVIDFGYKFKDLIENQLNPYIKTETRFFLG